MLFPTHNYFGGHRFHSRTRRALSQCQGNQSSKKSPWLQASYSSSRTDVLTTDWEDFVDRESSNPAPRDGKQGFSIDQVVHRPGISGASPSFMMDMGWNVRSQLNYQSDLNTDWTSMQGLWYRFQHPLHPFLAPSTMYNHDVGGRAYRHSIVHPLRNSRKGHMNSEICSCTFSQKCTSSASSAEKADSTEGVTSMWDYDKNLSPRKRKIRVPRSILICSRCRPTRFKQRVRFAEEELATYLLY